jgi:hypothetical protein
MTDDTSQATASGTKERQPYRVRLPGFVRDQDVGLGDAVTGATSMLGSSLARVASCAPRRSTVG